MSTAELLLHPVRLSILQGLLGDETVTTKVLAQRLPGTPPATLYRHVAALVEAGVIEVVEERRIRGAVERTLRLDTSRASVAPEDPDLADRTVLRAGFLAYLVSLATAFDTYLDRDTADASADLVTFRQAAVSATDEEWLAMLTAVRAAITPLLNRTPPPGARRRLLATVGLPAD